MALKDIVEHTEDAITIIYKYNRVPILTQKPITDMYNEKITFSVIIHDSIDVIGLARNTHLTGLFKKNFMAPFYGWGSTASRLQSHYKETVYFLPLSFQIFLVSFDQPRKDERLSRPWNHPVVFNTGPWIENPAP